MSKHKDTEEQAGEIERFPRWQTVAIIVIIVLALLSLLLTGGNNQTWYPGKPYNAR